MFQSAKEFFFGSEPEPTATATQEPECTDASVAVQSPTPTSTQECVDDSVTTQSPTSISTQEPRKMEFVDPLLAARKGLASRAVDVRSDAWSSKQRNAIGGIYGKRRQICTEVRDASVPLELHSNEEFERSVIPFDCETSPVEPVGERPERRTANDKPWPTFDEVCRKCGLEPAQDENHSE